MIRQLENSTCDIELLYSYLSLVDQDFRIPLSQKVDLHEYAVKLLIHGIVIAYEENNHLLSCRGFYCNDVESGIAYGVMMSTLPEAQGRGYARLLIEEMFKICRSKGFKAVISSSVNPKAVALYKSLGYKEINVQPDGNEIRVTLKYDLI